MTIKGKIRHASRQSDLSRWLRDNHTWFKKELDEAGVPNWDEITKLLCDAGLTDRNGNPYSKDAVRIGVNRFFKNASKTPPSPSAAKSTYSLQPIPQPQTIDAPEVDFIALSKAVKDKRTIK